MKKYGVKILYMNISVKTVIINCESRKMFFQGYRKMHIAVQKIQRNFAMGVNQVILRECKLERRNRAVPPGVMVFGQTFLKQWVGRIVLRI